MTFLDCTVDGMAVNLTESKQGTKTKNSRMGFQENNIKKTNFEWDSICLVFDTQQYEQELPWKPFYKIKVKIINYSVFGLVERGGRFLTSG